MLEAGEDARFIARRLVILASEDVGMADPMALVVADAAARAVEFVGLPEAQLNLAQAVVHLADGAEVEPVGRRPSGRPGATSQNGFAPEVPLHLRDGHPRAEAGPRRGPRLPLPPRRPPGLGRAGLPRRARAPALLRADDHGAEAPWSFPTPTRSPGRAPTGRREVGASSKVAAPWKPADAAAVVVAVASAVAVVVLLWAVVALTRTMATCADRVEELRSEALPVVAELRSTVGQANAELERVDTLLGTAESVTATVDSASRLAYLAFSNPVIKALAFATGTGQGGPALPAPRREGALMFKRLFWLIVGAGFGFGVVVLAHARRSARPSSATRPSGSPPTCRTRCAASAPTSAPRSPRAATPCGSARRSCGPSSTPGSSPRRRVNRSEPERERHR